MTQFITRQSLAADLAKLGIAPGDTLMVHAAMSKVGRLLNGPDAAIWAMRDCVGPTGTVVAYTDWDARYEELLDENGRVPDAWRPHIPPFDPLASRAIRDHGAIAEFLRTTPGAIRSASPGASVAAIGAGAEWLTRDHPIDYGYGEGSPWARLVEVGAKVLMLGAPIDTMTIIHHAEHLAAIPDKRIKRVEVPFQTDNGIEWRMVEEFDTGLPISPAFDGFDHFTAIVEAFLATGRGRRGKVGQADCVLVDARSIVAFAVDWIERHAGALDGEALSI